MANYAIRAKKLGLPQHMKDSFQLLGEAGIITAELADRMQKMVGFRNIGVHEYEKLDLRSQVFSAMAAFRERAGEAAPRASGVALSRNASLFVKTGAFDLN